LNKTLYFTAFTLIKRNVASKALQYVEICPCTCHPCKGFKRRTFATFGLQK
jgi:hypothetical protein